MTKSVSIFAIDRSIDRASWNYFRRENRRDAIGDETLLYHRSHRPPELRIEAPRRMLVVCAVRATLFAAWK